MQTAKMKQKAFDTEQFVFRQNLSLYLDGRLWKPYVYTIVVSAYREVLQRIEKPL